MFSKKIINSRFKLIFFIACLILGLITYITIFLVNKRIILKPYENEIIRSEFFNIEDFNSDVLYPIQNDLKDFIEIINEEQKFLNGIIRKIKPKKIVEIGVAYGGTAALMLNAIKDIKDAKLF